MAETLISPGVLATENDQSFISQGPISVGAALIGPTVKGPVEIPTIVTSYSDYQAKFGTTFNSGGQAYTYFTSIAAYNYFNNGGESLLVARVVSGTFTSATSSNVLNNVPSTPGAFATASKDLSGLGNPINIEFRIVDNSSTVYRFLPTASGNYQDDADGKLYFFASGALSTTISNLATKITSVTGLGVTSNAATNTISFTGSVSSSAYNGYTFQTGSGTSFSTQATLGGGVNGVGSNTFILRTLSKGTIMNSTSIEDSSGALASGSADNVRWQIVNASTSSGTFDLLIRRGNDTTNNQTVLETWTNLSLDPFAPNYIAAVIGDYVTSYNSVTNQIDVTGTYPNRSAYVGVSSVLYPTPNYFDNSGNPVASYTASIPTNTSGTFGAATGNLFGAGANYYSNITSGVSNTQGLTGSDYNNMISLLANQDDYRFNVLLTPGLFSSDTALGTSQITTAINNTQNRGDSIYVIDLAPYGYVGSSNVSSVTSLASSRNTSYAAAYWPWVQTVDPDLGKNVWVPASTMIGGVYAYNDSVSEPWFAPAGINRGGLSNVIRAEFKLNQSQRDTLYSGKVNPIATFPGQGTVVYGQKTLQTKASALDRVNVRRLLIALKSYISQVAQNLVFEQNSIATRNQFLSQVNPYLASVQQRQGLYAFRVIMDDSNNTPDVIDRNQLVGQIYIQPTKTAEFIYLDFNILPTGVLFPA
jgi:phage tail sheath protein FI